MLVDSVFLVMLLYTGCRLSVAKRAFTELFAADSMVGKRLFSSLFLMRVSTCLGYCRLNGQYFVLLQIRFLLFSEVGDACITIDFAIAPEPSKP